MTVRGCAECFFAGVSLLQDDPFDAVPERPKHEENQEQSEGESQCPPVRRLIDRRIGYIAVDGGQQTDDADEEAHQKVRLQPHLLSGSRSRKRWQSSGNSTTTAAANA